MRLAFWKKKKDLVRNHFKSDFGKRALVSAVNRPFIKPLNFRHNNQLEAMEMALIFNELGYQVDVINYCSTLDVDYSQYEVLFGAGEAFEKVFLKESTGRRPRTILYMPGAIVPVWNRASLRRLQEVYDRRGAWVPRSGRMVVGGMVGCEKVVDGLVVLGNAVIADPYRAVTSKPVHELPLFFIQVAEAGEIMQARDLAATKRHFMWFAGGGLVHKGLDLVLEAFSRHPELHLHVYGNIEQEAGFCQAFRHELRELPNVHVETWLALERPEFRAALLANAFIICPSSAEGCCSSVLNACGNGGLVPIVTKECGIDLKDYGVLVGDTTVEAVEAALLEAVSFSDEELERRMRSAAAFIRDEHSRERFHERMKASILSILASAEG